jgi:preprotein translocase subunit SecA
VYKNVEGKFTAIINDIRERHEKGQPILIGTVSIEKNEDLSRRLKQAGIPHEILNAKNNEREGAIIAQAGKLGAVTVATNMAGRGVDIILGGTPPDILEAEKIKAVGGLHVVGTERHESRRIDNQLRGRAGRQGDPGSSQFFLSLEDDLMRIFGGGKIQGMMQAFKIPDDMPIQAGLLNRAIAQAQNKVEGMHFDARKHLLDYDDVLNKQRVAIYKKRQEILERGEPPQILAALDMFWMNHLEDMEALGDAVRLRAYGQHDPLVEYRRDGHITFQRLLEEYERWVTENREKFTQQAGTPTTQMPVQAALKQNVNEVNTATVSDKVGRNDPCPCGAVNPATGEVYKWKKCGMINAPHHKK